MALSSAAALEAILFAAGEPLTKKRLLSLLTLTDPELTNAATELRTKLHGSGLVLMEAGDEFELRTISEAASVVQKFRESELSRDLGKAGLEALAVILYKNGASRGEIDWVRGVNSSAALRSLQLRGLVTRTEDAKDRRKIRYEATIEALAHLGVSSMSELPHFEELEQSIDENIAKDPEASAEIHTETYETA